MSPEADRLCGAKTAVVLGGVLLGAFALFSVLAALDHRDRAQLERLDDAMAQQGSGVKGSH
jgi:hypothetical protein